MSNVMPHRRAMSKPTIFFSHSSRDQLSLVDLKDRFVSKTGGSVDVFLSSDGQSIPFGRNWVHRIEEALNAASVMFTFVSPNSIRSNWLYFESGFAYSKGIRVVPVGFLGVDLSAIPPPLGLLQGFNITSAAGLNNIVSIANDVFEHQHAESFTSDDFLAVCSSAGATSNVTFGDNAGLVEELFVALTVQEGLDCTPAEAIDRIAQAFEHADIPYQRSETGVELLGLSIFKTQGYVPEQLQAKLAPGVADVSLPILDKAIRSVRSAGLTGVTIRVDFSDLVDYVSARHKLTGRIFGTDIKLAPGDSLIWGDLRFSIGHLLSFAGRQARRGATYISLELLTDQIPQAQVRDLLTLLFQREVLFVRPSE